MTIIYYSWQYFIKFLVFFNDYTLNVLAKKEGYSLKVFPQYDSVFSVSFAPMSEIFPNLSE